MFYLWNILLLYSIFFDVSKIKVQKYQFLENSRKCEVEYERRQ